MTTNKPTNSTPLKENLVSKAVQQSSNVDEFRKYIEVEVLKIIQTLVEKGDVTQERIQSMAQLTLQLIQPNMTLEQLYQNAIKLDDEYSELAPIVMNVMREYEDKYAKKALEQVSNLIKSGDYDQAQHLVQKVLQFKMGG